MKIGDFILNLDIKMIEDFLNNAKPDQIERLKEITLAVSFLVDMAVEIIEAPSIIKYNMPLNEMGMFSCQVLAQASALSVYRYSCRMDNPEAYINTFKHIFETILISLSGEQS